MESNRCPSCSAELRPSATFCHKCGELLPALVDPNAYVPNKVPIDDLIKGILLAPMMTWLAVICLRDGKAILSFSRNAKTVIEVSGPWSSLLGAISMLMGAAAFGSMVVDHFDKRPNEHLYKKVMNLCLVGFGVCFLLAWIVGSYWEHIQWVSVK